MDKELIDHIKNSLVSHEETYTPGAWERFSIQEEKKRRVFMYWPLWSAAAIILIFGGVFLLQNNKSSKTKNIVKTVKPIHSEAQPAIEKRMPQVETKPESTTVVRLKTPETNFSISHLNSTDYKEQKIIASTKTLHKEVVLVSNFPTGVPVTSTLVSAHLYQAVVFESETKLLDDLHQERIATNLAVKKAEFVPEQKKSPLVKITFEQLLERDSYNSSQAKNEKTGLSTKWEPGIFIAPSIGNDNKVNLNYGFSLSYNLADKISISSGIAYAALSTTGNSSAGNVNDALVNSQLTTSSLPYSGSSKNLESVNASVRGITIPLELKYSISGKFYTGIGLSALAVLNNKQNNNYSVSTAQNTTVPNEMGISEQKMLLITKQVSEPQAPSSTASQKYIGFYNFSLGYKQKISRKNNFAIEPFLRVPMKAFSNENLNFTNGGVRLKFDF